ncbi:MAG: transporter [Reyranellaceae bacterium]
MRWASAAALVLVALPAHADEGGASFWLPGQFASFAAVPADPGFAVETIFYVRNATAAASVSLPRGGRVLNGLDTIEQYVYLTPGYAFADPVLHGQLWLGATFSAGRNQASTWGGLTGPRGNAIATSVSDTASGISDLYPMASLKWQVGAHNFMAYTTAGVPLGAYDPNRTAGVGLGHWALDWGMGYTFQSAGGFEASLTAGMTYNFVNPTTGYQSGVDGHLDFGTSWSFSDSFYVGAVAYLFNQLGSDTGAPPWLGGFQSRVAGAGPQLGGSFSLGPVAVDLSLRGYKEFAAQNRPEGWNVWFTVGLSRASAEARR